MAPINPRRLPEAPATSRQHRPFCCRSTSAAVRCVSLVGPRSSRPHSDSNLDSRVVYQLDFEDFDATEFEEFCFELLRGLPGFHNVDWRKGTPKSTSPADRGREIAAEVDHVDVDGARHVERWFVDC